MFGLSLNLGLVGLGLRFAVGLRLDLGWVWGAWSKF